MSNMQPLNGDFAVLRREYAHLPFRDGMLALMNCANQAELGRFLHDVLLCRKTVSDDGIR